MKGPERRDQGAWDVVLRGQIVEAFEMQALVSYGPAQVTGAEFMPWLESRRPDEADCARPSLSHARSAPMVSRCDTDSGTCFCRLRDTSSVVNSRPSLKATYMASMMACSSSAPV